jgi:hypothetical protein
VILHYAISFLFSSSFNFAIPSDCIQQLFIKFICSLAYLLVASEEGNLAVHNANFVSVVHFLYSFPTYHGKKNSSESETGFSLGMENMSLEFVPVSEFETGTLFRLVSGQGRQLPWQAVVGGFEWNGMEWDGMEWNGLGI